MSCRLLAATVALVLLAHAATIAAQEPKFPDVKAFDKLVVDALREVHNKGADLFNTKKEFEGAYRMYHGALLTVRPLIGHRPEAQKMIEEGLAAAEKESNLAQRAFRLHETIEAVRSNLKGEPGAKSADKKPDEMKSGGEGKGKGKKKGKQPVAATGGPGFRGTVTFKGQPVPAGEVLLVSLDKPQPVVINAQIQDNGQYAPMAVVPPGKYVVIVVGKHIPPKYHLTTTSGLEIEVTQPPTVFNINLN
jgi:hypothetical protein